MKLKTILLLLTAAFISQVTSAQKFTAINIRLSDNKNNIGYVDICRGNLIFTVTSRGNVVLRAVDPAVRRVYQDGFTNSGRLISLDGAEIKYYDSFNAYYAGKVKSAGEVNIMYNDQFDGFDNRGRVKSVGDIKFAYTDRFDGFDNRGKIKSIGDIKVTYYDRFDGSELNGKVKSIGSTIIKYYDRFDGVNAGRVKSITGNTPGITISNAAEEPFAENN